MTHLTYKKNIIIIII